MHVSVDLPVNTSPHVMVKQCVLQYRGVYLPGRSEEITGFMELELAGCSMLVVRHAFSVYLFLFEVFKVFPFLKMTSSAYLLE